MDVYSSFATAMSSSTSQPQRSIPPEDRISILPDSILYHILSFLPTKFSATTSILSKRWKPLWLSLLHLDFDFQSFIDFNTFRHAVYFVMLSREYTLPIKSLRLKSCSEHVFINGFLDAAMQPGIEYLDLETTTGKKDFELTLTPNIFSCKTLTVLKLKNLTVNKILTRVHFPLLKILHLDKVCFLCYEDIFKFPLSSPILEDFSVNDLQLRPGSKFISEKFISETSNVKCLTNLVKASYSARQDIPLFLFTWAHILKIKLRCPHLFYKVHTLHNLTQLELTFFGDNMDDIWSGKWKWVLEVLQHSPKLQHLTIHQEIENIGISEAYWEDPQIVPQCLSSQLKTFLFRGCRCKNSELQFIEYIMQNSKVLRTMTIHSASSIDLNAKHQMLKKLAVWHRNYKLILD
ncbi:unnamed protein product [Trifolium pratense]|uniref:Uncharacterized protein n=1 Tax=Trifolium pratense TaxID=57577 RepID=A0ACB0JCN9_TRIPR|nr:unnamed protein product [Trifolium pratense]